MRYPDPKKMMSWDKFAALNIQSPYVFEIKSRDDKHLLFYGSKHSQNPQDPTFEDIRREFHEFEPDMVFVEGMEELNTSRGKERAKTIIYNESEEESIIHNGGEAGFTLRLAFANNIDVKSPEATYARQVKFTESSGFSREAIFVYFATRYIRQLQRYPQGAPRPSLEEYSLREFKCLKKVVRWGDFQITLENYLNKYKEITKKEFSLGDMKLGDIVDPTPWPLKHEQQGVTNKIARVLSDYRDEYTMKRIAEVLIDHVCLFIVYGSGHAIRQEPALREYFTKA